MQKAASITKLRILWVIAALLMIWAFPRPLKWAGRFLFSKILPNIALILSILSALPLNKLIESMPRDAATQNTNLN